MSGNPGIWSLLPPLVAIGAAFWLKEPILALFFGAWLGSSMISGSPFEGTLRLLDKHVLGSVADADHAAILLFTLMLGGVVGLMSRSGGMRSMVDRVSRYATSPRAGMLSTWALGLVIFFDDYANSLLVGQSMRPVSDRLKISREKLAYIVDSTAAPVAVIVPVSTWVGYEIALIAAAYKDLGLQGDVYLIFLQSIPYRFYGILTLLFVFLVAWTGRDFGPMLRAEKRARKGALTAKDASPLAQIEAPPDSGKAVSAFWGMFPIFMVIAVTGLGIFFDGRAKAGPGAPLWECLGEANSLHVLLWSAFAGSVAALVISVRAKALGLKAAVEAWVKGCQSMMTALVILTLAWTLGAVCKELKTADALAGLASAFPAALVPTGTFLLAAFVSFVTGTSWGTMAILFPIVVPLAHKLPMLQGGDAESILLGSIGAVLAGSVFGDHVSPISDTTILSSTGSSCDHMHHVRTQMPYACAVALASIVFGSIPAGYGMSPWLGLLLGGASLVLVVRYVGKKT